MLSNYPGRFIYWDLRDTQSSTSSKNDVWFLTSGYDNHMAVNESSFTNMDKSVNSQVKSGNKALVNTKGKGTDGIQTKERTNFIWEALLLKLQLGANNSRIPPHLS